MNAPSATALVLWHRVRRATGGVVWSLAIACQGLPGEPAAAALAGPQVATGEDLFNLSPAELAQIPAVSASLTPQRLADSPASVSLITREQIRQLGARTLYDVLRHVPGLRVDVTNRGRPVLSMRGVHRDASSQVLFLLDGHGLNEPANGSATFLFEVANLPLENIARIEVIRGPGSARFGSNAFLGVVNVITGAAADIDGAEATLHSEWEADGHIGSEVNLLLGRDFQTDRSASLNLNLVTRDGERIPVAADIAGRAGLADRAFEQVDVQARGRLGPFSVQARMTHQDRGESHGATYMLNPDDNLRFDGGFVEVDGSFTPGPFTRLLTRAWLDYYDGETRIGSLRRGTIPPGSRDYAFNATGKYSRLGMKTGKAGVELRGTDTRFPGHELSYGLIWEYQAQEDLRTFSNDIGSGHPVWPLRDVTATNPFGQDANRTLVAPYIEDLWRINDALTLNAGVRLDHYSDFGDSVNPRLGLTWHPHPRYGIRALFGTAFRAPDFRSLFLESPVIVGNPDLSAEQVRTLELGFAANPVDPLSLRATLYENRLEQLIIAPPGALSFENTGAMTSRGLELEAAWQWRNGASVSLNYSYVDARLADGNPAPDEPRNSASALLWTPIGGRLGAGLSLYWQDDSPRAAIDRRPDLPGYLLLDCNLIYRLSDRLELGLAAYNLLGEDYALPAPPNTIAADYLGPGRSLRAELRMAFP